ncbi:MULTISPECIES: KpsF/GutQ family sugar-phosphate isomerase [Acetobacter]|uniref:KpsF/GutQ family sugar-phosphate isomerase n=1 Tax=Acetobacter thailandicus TaxID=1502842 RepID=A0ABT3QBQ8_9PROT|nr:MULTISPECIES: KpsF/GutQ family sugar-phosphate isomerase [Acetobacter]MBS0984991.1 KpsF/GutQ family sugar-phosphate isomerase [Acetobacter thailandicus]MBS1003470.1 KpsF/GutQ family sugar-phosphate isomerase [Acetobacter thailandicus]MCX2562696.1 KpsF/GutQ family sugar-phosphate isomerase [Acetobacter thailandicus]NHN94761.1 KpsF/GutQ family sugar-phosphate isomerase [Acetobacter thailandicus]OUI89580.1 D-arabinose 5-phosphate [Acetobacter sp. DmW_043]
MHLKTFHALTASAIDVVRTEQAGLKALEEALQDCSGLGSAFTDAVTLISGLTGRLVVSGIGKSGHIARKIQATLSSTGTPALFVHPAEASHGDLGMIRPGDAVLAFSNSGETTELGDIAAHTRSNNLPLLAVTSQPDSTLACAADIALIMPAMKEACPMGLAPTTSTTIQLAFGDALAVALLQKRGFTASDFSSYHPGGRLGMRLRTVRDLMRTGDMMPLGHPDTSMRDIIMEMTRKALGCIGITDENETLVGLITDGDLRRALDLDLAVTQAKDVMNTTPLTISPDIFVSEAVSLMNTRSRPVTSLFVLDDHKKPLGVVHMHDLLKAGGR